MHVRTGFIVCDICVCRELELKPHQTKASSLNPPRFARAEDVTTYDADESIKENTLHPTPQALHRKPYTTKPKLYTRYPKPEPFSLGTPNQSLPNRFPKRSPEPAVHQPWTV